MIDLNTLQLNIHNIAELNGYEVRCEDLYDDCEDHKATMWCLYKVTDFSDIVASFVDEQLAIEFMVSHPSKLIR